MTSDARARDADLVAALGRGERAAAFDLLVVRYTPRLYRLCWLLLRDSAHAEDAVQDSLLRAWRALDSYDPARAALSTWLYSITRHHCLGLLGRPALQALSLDEPDGETLAATLAQPEAAPADARATLQTLIDALPETPRACLQLFYWEDRSVAEVAAQLGLPDNTVKTHLHRARARLRQALADQGLDDPALWL
ncbi:sigma-70 family RNA polymerase sigma factor [Ideonella sp. 4Y11]|uniref:Sigma-70 family RNA polymerase sigma factor n=1 Tax=Ideonella aquatica TaxID=2824119 RepID=A0A940YVX2_9BURK|nr:sigma-70 family RNA polymerase sigma factor [Ideonella aquatica]MBQ0960235.1 sigma-70 family RNA polymerase sigma factor [Ideonella aquatica]